MCYYEEPIEELHRLLDERGVEWSATTGSAGTIWTHWRAFNGYIVSAMDNCDGTLEIFDEWDVTPAQAIAATLGEPITDTEKAALEQLRDDLQQMNTENAELRQELAIREASEQEKVIEYLRQENVDWEVRYNALRAENTKLRKLLGKVLSSHDKMCAQRGKCFGCIYFDGELKTPFSQLCVPLANLREAHELGIEVDQMAELNIKVPIKFSEKAQKDLYEIYIAYKELAETRGDENAKLRELVYELLTDPDAWDYNYFKWRTHELGVEVDE